jgi:zinc protease
VLIHEDHALPIVAVNVWYHVGSKNEVPGRTGFAHLFEHLMFEGSQHYDRGYFHPLQEAGASLNGSTNADRTNYWEVVPTNALDLALWMESDRMGYLLPALTDAKFENQRDVVLNERRQNYENRPYGLAGMAIVSALYPADHPYHCSRSARPTTSARAHSTTSAFFQRYYQPRNASLALAGGHRSDRARRAGRAVLRGDSRRREAPARDGARAAAASGRYSDGARGSRRAAAALPRVAFAGALRDGDAELDLIAEVLSSGKTSRLYRALVYEQRIATEVAGVAELARAGSFFQIVATAAPGRTLAESSARSRRRWRADRARADRGELERCLAQAEAHFLFRLQTVGGFGGKSDQLNAYNTFLGDPGYFDAGSASATVGDAGSCATPPRRISSRRARHPERRAARPRRAGAAGSQPVAVS